MTTIPLYSPVMKNWRDLELYEPGWAMLSMHQIDSALYEHHAITDDTGTDVIFDSPVYLTRFILKYSG